MKSKIQENLEFIYQFIDEPKSIGAIFPSSKYLVKTILRFIDFTKENLKIVEYGPGTGSFTKEIVKNLKETDKLIVIEQNKKFANTLKQKFNGIENISIYQDCAKNISEILKDENIDAVDYIISGIPFSSIPKEVSENIMDNTKKIMKEKSLFIAFQYSMLKLKAFKKYFTIIKKEFAIRNVPSAYVICMKKKD